MLAQIVVAEAETLRHPRPVILDEQIGFRDKRVILMPFDDASGVNNDSLVVLRKRASTVTVGPGLLGRVIDGSGNPILQPYIVTRGDANSTPDPNATPVSRVRGVVVGWHHEWGTVLAWAGSPQGRALMLVPPLVALGLLELVAVLTDRRRPAPVPQPAEGRSFDAILLD